MASSSSGRVFAQLRQRARSSFVGKHRLDVILHSRLEDGPKYVSMSVLKSAFGVAGLVLTEEEAEYLVKRFADNRRRVEWRNLMAALDVAAPADFTDPDRSFLDNLPQPYRLIVSVLDTEIVDRAWALIVERHPELDTSVADEARAAAEIDLKRSCPPSVRLQNPHPPLLSLGGGRQSVAISSSVAASAEGVEQDRAEGGADGRVSPTPPAEGEDENGNDANADADADGNGDGDNGIHDIRAGDGVGGGVTVMRWDARGKLLFTGGRDGSVCLRVGGAFDDIAVQVSSRGVGAESSDGTEEAPTPWAVKFLSHPVGALRDQWGRPSSVRIAAVVTSPTEEDGGAGGEKVESVKERGGVAAGETSSDPALPPPARSSSCVSVLEVTLPEAKANADDDNSTTSGSSQRLRPSRTGGDKGDAASNSHHNINTNNSYGPTLRAVCVVKLPPSEGAVACALSPDGKRLAVCLSSGRIATWVLPSFKPPSEGHPPSAQRNISNTTGGGSENDVDIHAHDVTTSGGGEIGAADRNGSASLGESSTSLAGDDDAAALAKAEAAAAAEAAATAPPVQLTQPEFSIPHLPSPEELAYAKALHEYRRKVEAGELQQPTSSPGVGEEEEEGCTPPPRPPQLSGCAHHLGRVEFLPAGVADGGGGSGGGLSVWRTNSNVWRLYRLPPPPVDGVDGTPGGQGEDGANGNGGGAAEVSHTGTGADASGEDTTQVGGGGGDGCDAVMTAKLDISSLPSAEWVLPSPITALAVSEEAAGERFRQSVYEMHAADEGGVGGDWSCCSDPYAPAAELLPLVAIGTENGGVYVCDAVLGTTREGLSRHRSRVTALAFHRKTFLVSGGADEMLQIHHIPIAAGTAGAVGDIGGGGGRGGGRCCPGGTPRLRCLHDARGSAIVRVACLREAPLTFAEDTSGRIVAYDLLSGSMLGVLALGSNSVASATATKPGNYGGGTTAAAETAAQKEGVLWAGGGDYLAAIVSVEEGTHALPSSLHGSGESLGVWSAADVMWELSPGMRALAGEVRPLSPTDVTGLFFDLVPVQRKDVEGKLDFHQHQPNRGNHSLRGATPPPATGTTNSTNVRRFHSSAAVAAAAAVSGGSRPSRASGISGGGGSRGAGAGGAGNSPVRTAGVNCGRSAASKTASTTDEDHGRLLQPNNHRTTLTEGNVARLLAAAGGTLRTGGFSGGEEGIGVGAGGGGGVPWRSEVGAVGRVRRYMESRGGERAARQARLDNVTRNLLHAL